MPKESVRLYLTYQKGKVTAYIESDEGLQEYQRNFTAPKDCDPHDYCAIVAEIIERELSKPVRWSMVIKEGGDAAEEKITDDKNDTWNDIRVLSDVFARSARLNTDDEYPILGNKDCTEVSLRSEAQVECFKRIPKKSVICVDVETTGKKPGYDEVLQVSICNGNGILLLNSYVRPVRRKRWPDAQEINQITWDMVKDAPTIVDLSDSIEAILGNADLVIGYNLRFDLEFLKRGRVNIDRSWWLWDIMPDCSVIMGKWSDYYGDYSFVKLSKAAKHYGIEYGAHDSGEDVRATVKVFYAMLDDMEYIEKVKRLESIDIDGEKQRIEYLREKEKRKIQEEERTRNNIWTIRGCLIGIIVVLCLLIFSCTSGCMGSRTYRSYKSSYVIATPVLQFIDRRSEEG